jgi:HD-like signal output (HDOD) protein
MEILWVADALDEHFEVEPYAEGVESGDEPSLHTIALEHLRAASLEELRRIVPALPVFPSAALKAITELVRPDVENSALERLAKSDPVMAGRIVSTANSALFAPRSHIRNLAQAISYIGPSLARHILLAAALRPAYSRPGLRPVWQHALECADVAGIIAERTNAVLPAEAVLAGLTHDIGLLALSMLGREAQDRCARLVEKGCPSRTSETVVYGFDHAEAGAEVLSAWNFPLDLIEGVRHHHIPEQSDSPLGSVLYLAEFCCTPDEDLPSAARLQLASSRIGIKVEEIIALKSPGTLTTAFQS